MLGILDSTWWLRILCIGSVSGGMLGVQVFFWWDQCCGVASWFACVAGRWDGGVSSSLPVGLSSKALAVLFPFSFLGPLSQDSIRELAGFSACVFCFTSCSCDTQFSVIDFLLFLSRQVLG